MRWKVFSGSLNAKILILLLERLARAKEKDLPDPGQPARTPLEAPP
jgi:hypothetical protein